MATPIVLTNLGTMTLERGTPNSWKFLVQNPDGSNLNVTTGYACKMLSLDGVNINQSPAVYQQVDVATHGTLTFGNGFVQLDIDSDRSSFMSTFGTKPLEVFISNDAWATQAKVFRGTFNQPTSMF